MSFGRGYTKDIPKVKKLVQNEADGGLKHKIVDIEDNIDVEVLKPGVYTLLTRSSIDTTSLIFLSECITDFYQLK